MAAPFTKIHCRNLVVSVVPTSVHTNHFTVVYESTCALSVNGDHIRLEYGRSWSEVDAIAYGASLLIAYSLSH